jgi:DNA-binding winged helix-turn-helix (wHTH) protein/Tfp pilus assembly protein PilF
VPAERLLLRDKHVVHLTPKVFDTLVVLVEHGGRLLSKRELLGLIWRDTVVEENNLTQAICAIRKALGGSDDSREYVATVPKLGYRFVASVRIEDGETSGGDRAHDATDGVKTFARPVVLALALALIALLGLREGWWHLPQRARALGNDGEHTASLRAYQNYLDGLGALNQRTDPSLRAAIFYFERAIEQDSSYALAYAALADSYVLLGLYNMSSQEVLPKAQLAAIKAVQLDSTSAEAHTALAAIDAFYNWDWLAARKEFERALQLSPDYPLAHHWYGVAYWVPMGSYDQALAQLTQARKLDSQSLIIQTDVGWVYYVMREYDRAIVEYDSVIKRDANFLPAHYMLSLAYERLGQYAQALSELRTSRRLNSTWAVPSPPGSVENLTGYRSARRSRHTPASAPGEGQPGLYAGALAYMRLGERARALLWLQFAYRQRDPGLVYLAADPVFDGVRNDPSFRDLTRRVGVVH